MPREFVTGLSAHSMKQQCPSRGQCWPLSSGGESVSAHGPGWWLGVLGGVLSGSILSPSPHGLLYIFVSSCTVFRTWRIFFPSLCNNVTAWTCCCNYFQLGYLFYVLPSYFFLFQSMMVDVYTNPEKHVVLSNNVKVPILGLGEKPFPRVVHESKKIKVLSWECYWHPVIFLDMMYHPFYFTFLFQYDVYLLLLFLSHNSPWSFSYQQCSVM